MALVGIDLGTTNSLIAIWRDGDVEIIKNSMGNDMTPSVVSVDEDGSVLVGETAKQRRVSHPAMTAAEFKRDMGTDTVYTLGDKKFLPEELSAFVLKKMIGEAENYLGEKIEEAVISVPAYFDDNQREATKRAAKIAGVEVKRLVNEPSAAILYRQWKSDNTGREGIYLVVDFGGGTLDISVVDCFENIIEIIAVSGNNQLGGKDFDRAIAMDFCKKCGLEFQDLSEFVQENLLWTAEGVKRQLSEYESAAMHVIINNQEYKVEYDTDELLKATADVLVQMKKALNEALRGARVEMHQIVDVILVGGSCKMPVVQKYLSALFRRNIIADDESDYYVGLGTGVLTGIIGRDEKVSELVMTDVCPFSLGTGTYKGTGSSQFYMSVLIPKNSILPVSKSRVFQGLEPFQKQIRFEVFQGEEMFARNNLSLGELTIDVTPDSEGNTKAEITFRYDINGVLEVTARDLIGGNVAETVLVSKNSQLTEAQIEQKRREMNEDTRFEKDKEENRNILAWGQRLHAQADNRLKEYIRHLMIGFADAVERNDIAAIQREKKMIVEQLQHLEQFVNRDYFGGDNMIDELLEDEDE